MSHRLRRISEILKRELGVLISREISFPVPLVTISDVDVSPDLKNAHVFVTSLCSEQERSQILDLLEQDRPRLQAELSRRVILKQTPHLHFKFDTSLERGTRILEILEELGLGVESQP